MYKSFDNTRWTLNIENMNTITQNYEILKNNIGKKINKFTSHKSY